MTHKLTDGESGGPRWATGRPMVTHDGSLRTHQLTHHGSQDDPQWVTWDPSSDPSLVW
jgi:hypothetical protein